MNITIIAAMTKNRVIGNGNKLPWHIPQELKHFKTSTMGKPIIMGRGTFDSLGRKSLPGRKTIVLTKNQNLSGENFIQVTNIDDALKAAGKVNEVIIAGGANIYQQFLPLANTMYLSIIHKDYTGNVFFPEYDLTKWKNIATQEHDEFTVQVFKKIN